MKLSNSSVFLFDFDGTLCSNFLEAVQILNQLADEFRFKKVDLSDLEPVRALDTKTFLRTVGISTFKLPFVVRRARQEVQARIASFQPVPGISEVISQIASRGVRLGIVTSNSQHKVQTFLRRHQMDHFEFFSAGSSLLGKARLIKRLLRSYQLEKESIYYIGDETRDIDAAKSAGVKAIAVTWGYNSRTALEALHPDHLISKPQTLMNL